VKSIQGRLSLGLISVLVIVGLVVAQFSLWLFEVGLQRYLESGLRNESEILLTALVRGSNGLQLDESRLSPAYGRPLSGHYFRIDFSEEHWRSRSLWDLDMPIPDGPGVRANVKLAPDGQRLLQLRSQYRRFGQAFTITVAQDYTPVWESFRRMRHIGLGMGLGALLLILWLQRLTVKRALRPLERARQQIHQLQQGQRSQLDREVPVELAPLVEQINQLLAHTEDSLKRSRNALGNLGHALKTPLAVLLSLVSSERLQDHPQLRAELREQTAQIQRRLERELNRARLSGEALPGTAFDCDAELPGLLDTLGAIHGGYLQLRHEVPAGLMLPWDREDLLELLGNLLENACKFADSEVCLSIDANRDEYELLVDDDGPGIAVAVRDEVLQRGARLDQQVAGHGLGLGIVRDIVDAWGGELQLRDSPLGGLRASVKLPRRRLTETL
jgi:signal transduction histidine kinase